MLKCFVYIYIYACFLLYFRHDGCVQFGRKRTIIVLCIVINSLVVNSKDLFDFQVTHIFMRFYSQQSEVRLLWGEWQVERACCCKVLQMGLTFRGFQTRWSCNHVSIPPLNARRRKTWSLSLIVQTLECFFVKLSTEEAVDSSNWWNSFTFFCSCF